MLRSQNWLIILYYPVAVRLHLEYWVQYKKDAENLEKIRKTAKMMKGLDQIAMKKIVKKTIFHTMFSVGKKLRGDVTVLSQYWNV